MKPSDFLLSSLENIAKDFPQVHIKYAYNNIINTHIVELLPLEEYNNNSKLDDAWIPLSFNFRKKFPDEEITFLSSDSTLSVETPIFEWNVPEFIFENVSDLFSELSEQELKYSFPTCMPDESISFGKSIAIVLSYPEEDSYEEDHNLDTYYQAAA